MLHGLPAFAQDSVFPSAGSAATAADRSSPAWPHWHRSWSSATPAPGVPYAPRNTCAVCPAAKSASTWTPFASSRSSPLAHPFLFAKRQACHRICFETNDARNCLRHNPKRWRCLAAWQRYDWWHDNALRHVRPGSVHSRRGRRSNRSTGSRCPRTPCKPSPRPARVSARDDTLGRWSRPTSSSSWREKRDYTGWSRRHQHSRPCAPGRRGKWEVLYVPQVADHARHAPHPIPRLRGTGSPALKSYKRCRCRTCRTPGLIHLNGTCSGTANN